MSGKADFGVVMDMSRIRDHSAAVRASRGGQRLGMTQSDASREPGADDLAALVWQARRWSESTPDPVAERPAPDGSGPSFRARVRRLLANRPESDPPHSRS
ncbi:hypothetical protein [Embleya sp. NPDC020886]|uniref:hypothetical protein n=1 Tax=Embleya sp. NPDC020886 TaxID=3363980 RepID=UPI0037B7778A